MARVTHGDLARMLELLHTVNGARDIDTFCQQVVTTLPSFIAGEVAACLALDLSTFQILACAQSPSDRMFPEMERVFMRLAKEHPLLQHVSATGAARALRIPEVCTAAQWEAAPIYRAFYRRIGVRHLLGRGLRVGESTLIWIELGRSHREFTERDAFLLDLIGPHLEQPGRHAWLLGQHRERRNLVHQATMEFDLGIVRLRPGGTVREMTERAQALLTRYFGCADPLPTELQTWLTSCLEKRSPGAATPNAEHWVKPGAEADLEIRLIPGTGLSLLALQERPKLEHVGAFGLSQREEEVLRLVIQGKSNREIAEELHTSPRTVGKHLEHIYAKLGVTSRTAAAARSLERPRPT